MVQRGGHKFDSVCSLYFWNDVAFMQSAIKEGTLNDSFWGEFLPKCEQIASVHWATAESLNQVLRCVLVVGTVVNLISILVLALAGDGGWRRRTSTDIYLLSISLGDLTICVSSSISTQLPIGLGGIYVVCLGQIFGNIGLFACVTTVMVFTMERYKVVRDPLASLHACGRSKSLKIVTSLWLLFTLYSTAVVLFSLDYNNIEAAQPFDLDRTTIAFYVNVVLFYFIPMIVSLTLYALILKRVAQRKKNFMKSVGKRGEIKRSSQGHPTDPTGGEVMADDGEVKPNQITVDSPQQQDAASSTLTNINQFRKMLKMFILLMVSFLVLMSPYRLFALSMSLLSYNTDFSPEGWHLFYIQLTQWVTTIVFASNSIVNPILFNFLSTRFRSKLKGIGCTVATFAKNRVFPQCRRNQKDDLELLEVNGEVTGVKFPSMANKTEVTSGGSKVTVESDPASEMRVILKVPDMTLA